MLGFPLILLAALPLQGTPQESPPLGQPGEFAPPSRALSLALTASPRLAGTIGSQVGARTVRTILEAAGWRVEIDQRVVALSLPRRIAVTLRGGQDGAHVLWKRVARFDPTAIPPGDVPAFNAWSASGDVQAAVIDAGAGLARDWQRLVDEGTQVAGKITLIRYGGAYRGSKVALAESHGAAGVLLFSDPGGDGAGRGPTWPAGPWKPDWEVQRGSIASLGHAPGDPSTPGWASPAPGEGGRRLPWDEWNASLPTIPVVPIGSAGAALLQGALAAGEAPTARIEVDQPRGLHTIHNVIAHLPGQTPDFVMAGNHRDAWVRGAQDAGSGTVSLLRAAQRLGERARGGWTPPIGITLAFWDAEEFSLIGSTEWGEAHGGLLREHAVAYVNADAAVSGTRFSASGTIGLLSVLESALRAVPAPTDPSDPEAAPESIGDRWARDGEGRLRIPGSGSDFAVFLHHVGIPVLDISFGGNGGGQYHTAFDNFPLMDRFLDPGWVGHELAGHFLAELLTAIAERGWAAFDDAAEAEAAVHRIRSLEQEGLLAPEAADSLVSSFEELARARRSAEPAARGPRLLYALGVPENLAERSWVRNRLWAPSPTTGYGAETFPSLRRAAGLGPEELEGAIQDLERATLDLAKTWRGIGTRE